MIGLNAFARIVLRLANWIAGPDRQEWVVAMAAETDAADNRGTEWALGCLYAAVSDRVARDWRFVAAMVAAPVAAMALAVATTFVIFVGASAIGIPPAAGIPFMLFAPLPAAWLLGRMRPEYPSLLVGTLAFLLHQAGPLIAMWVMFGRMPHFWSPNMTYYNMPAYAGLLASWSLWVIATRCGASARRISAR